MPSGFRRWRWTRTSTGWRGAWGCLRAPPRTGWRPTCAASSRQSCWIELHHQLIFHGRRVCHARKPACPGCPLRALCPTGQGLIPDPHTGQALPAPEPGAPDRAAAAARPAGRGSGANRLPGAQRHRTAGAMGAGDAPGGAHDLLRGARAGSGLRCRPWGAPRTPTSRRIISLRPDLVILERDENTLAGGRGPARRPGCPSWCWRSAP